MSEKVSFPIRIAAKHERDTMLILPTQDELFQISHQAVGEIVAGMTVKAQINQAWINLGRPPMWRLLSAWYRDGSGSWSAAAVRDFQKRYLAWREAETRRAASSAATERSRQQVLDREVLERSRAEMLAQLARIELRLSHLKESVPV